MMLRFQRAVKRNSISTSGVGPIAMGDLGLPWFAQNNLLDLALGNIINAIFNLVATGANYISLCFAFVVLYVPRPIFAHLYLGKSNFIPD